MLGLKLFIPQISPSHPPNQGAPERIIVPLGSGSGEKLPDFNRIGIEGKSRYYFKAQPLK